MKRFFCIVQKDLFLVHLIDILNISKCNVIYQAGIQNGMHVLRGQSVKHEEMSIIKLVTYCSLQVNSLSTAVSHVTVVDHQQTMS